MIEYWIWKSRNDNDLHLGLRYDKNEKIDQYFSEHIERKINNDFYIKFNHNYY